MNILRHFCSGLLSIGKRMRIISIYGRHAAKICVFYDLVSVVILKCFDRRLSLVYGISYLCDITLAIVCKRCLFAVFIGYFRRLVKDVICLQYGISVRVRFLYDIVARVIFIGLCVSVRVGNTRKKTVLIIHSYALFSVAVLLPSLS